MMVPIMRVFRVAYAIVVLLITLPFLVLNLRLYAPGANAYGPDALGPDVVPQLNFIGEALRNGQGEEMQQLFPEGYFFSYVLYGLSWVEVGLRHPAGSRLYPLALQKARWALAQLNAPQGWAPFDPDLTPPYGVFYVGWKSWLLGGILLMQPEAERDPFELQQFEADIAALASAFDASPTPFLSAYKGDAWPVDSTVAMAAISLHDKLLAPKYAATISRWVDAAKTYLDPASGLLPHRVYPEDGTLLDGTRGSSQSVIARFLIEIDEDWGRQQYALYRQQFVTPFLSVPGVLEYPIGTQGTGDVDSGPLVAGFSASATVVQIAAAQAHGDYEVVNALIPASEAVGLPLTLGASKRYAFGIVPVGDAFLVWAKTSSPWVAQAVTRNTPALPVIVNPAWRLPFHLVTLLLLVPLWLPLAFMMRKKKQ
jgi:hypothetical protein